jgi:predicted RNase H-like HicB family nuclease
MQRVKRYLLNVELEVLDEGGFLASATNLAGAHAEGDTIGEALENLEDVARIVIELCLEEGLPLPEEFLGEAATPLIKAEIVIQIDA